MAVQLVANFDIIYCNNTSCRTQPHSPAAPLQFLAFFSSSKMICGRPRTCSEVERYSACLNGFLGEVQVASVGPAELT